MFMPNVRQFEAAQPVATPLRRMLSALPAGISGATLIETATGWQRAETLKPGDRLATWDGGFRPVLSAETERLNPFESTYLIRVPGGSLNNCRTVWLRPGQHVLIRSPHAAAVLEAEAVLLPATALTGYRGIVSERLTAAVTATTLRFAEDEVIFAASGLCLHCGAEAGPAIGTQAECGYLPVLDAARGRDLMSLIGTGALTTAELARAA
jgi:hypothetical protein